MSKSEAQTSDSAEVSTDEILVELPDGDDDEAPEPLDHPGADTLGELDWDGEGPLRWSSRPNAA
ncbi:MAG: hypothetical protein OEM22_06055 [Acidimicrobiia bacterium]|nr:hypothetical protein [Acidimicrobiia bacterium]MDH3470362.1 hypothetical protein [Acidimicrobiia bacterium]